MRRPSVSIKVNHFYDRIHHFRRPSVSFKRPHHVLYEIQLNPSFRVYFGLNSACFGLNVDYLWLNVTISEAGLHGGDTTGPSGYVSKHDEFCIKNKEFCIKHERFCVKNEELCVQNEELWIKNEELCVKNEEMCIENEGICINIDDSSAPWLQHDHHKRGQALRCVWVWRCWRWPVLLKSMNFVLKSMDSVVKMMDFVIKMMILMEMDRCTRWRFYPHAVRSRFDKWWILC